ncbi:hypothetical protein DQ04_12941000 [Trypanosoma grayi]|uniref:hypothetical protein n=1 Tax=Trypanosoma grayi TaxID=71804 RepID=UPI0004F46A75|nr:hypothetical protein DQ04_12941000 [Trypanosoma grayi]KEG06646.1 hypothetical protein DQ04_12941000 [Trypanosoma grayi]
MGRLYLVAGIEPRPLLLLQHRLQPPLYEIAEVLHLVPQRRHHIVVVHRRHVDEEETDTAVRFAALLLRRIGRAPLRIGFAQRHRGAEVIVLEHEVPTRHIARYDVDVHVKTARGGVEAELVAPDAALPHLAQVRVPRLLAVEEHAVAVGALAHVANDEVAHQLVALGLPEELVGEGAKEAVAVGDLLVDALDAELRHAQRKPAFRLRDFLLPPLLRERLRVVHAELHLIVAHQQLLLLLLPLHREERVGDLHRRVESAARGADAQALRCAEGRLSHCAARARPDELLAAHVAVVCVDGVDAAALRAAPDGVQRLLHGALRHPLLTHAARRVAEGARESTDVGELARVADTRRTAVHEAAAHARPVAVRHALAAAAAAAAAAVNAQRERPLVPHRRTHNEICVRRVRHVHDIPTAARPPL